MAKQFAGPPMTLGNMRHLGVQRAAANRVFASTTPDVTAR